MPARSDDLSFPVRSPDAVPGVSDVLFVCLANRCRSPFAAAIAARLFDDRVRIHSGGLLPGGSSMPSTGIDVGAMLGIDFRSHRSRELDRGDLAGFDLVLTMAKEQSRELVADDPRLQNRVFTLKQFARWIAANPLPAGERLGPWLDRVAGPRTPAELIGAGPEDDVADPIQSPVGEWIEMARDLTSLIGEVARGLTPVDTPTPEVAATVSGSRAELRRPRATGQTRRERRERG